MVKIRGGSKSSSDGRWLTALVANSRGEIYELEGYAAVGMAGSRLEPLAMGNTIPTPDGGEVMYLPDRRPIVFDLDTQRFERLDEDPYRPGEPVYPVSAFNSPGYVTTLLSAFEERIAASPLPLFSYGAVGWFEGGFRSTLIQVDREPRQDLRFMRIEEVRKGVRRMRRELPGNRLRAHLEKCALTYGCPAGKNFFLGRYEAPLPTSKACNARCLGCLSLQSASGIPSSQNRIDFTPAPEEIAEAALAHLERVPNGVVSFGQGCEGDPLLAAHVIEPAIRRIRARTKDGTINLNTNASQPRTVSQLFDAGLDTMRVSLNSVREPCYAAYFRPNGYTLADVFRSIDAAAERGGGVSLNYLNLPGFTDTPEELDAMIRFLGGHPVHMIQWRNLNFDPIRYWTVMGAAASQGPPLGMKTVLDTIRRHYPKLLFGYFNPPRERFAHIGGRQGRTAPCDGSK